MAESAGDLRQLFRLDTWKKAGVDEIAGAIDNVRTLADGQLTIDDAIAAIDLATGFGDEAKAAAKAAGAIEEAGDVVKGKLPVSELPSSGNTYIVDSKGNTIPLKPEETVTSSPDGKWIQVRDADGNPTGMRIDGGHKPTTHPDKRAQRPHAHVPGIVNPDGTPWLPLKEE